MLNTKRSIFYTSKQKKRSFSEPSFEHLWQMFKIRLLHYNFLKWTVTPRLNARRYIKKIKKEKKREKI